MGLTTTATLSSSIAWSRTDTSNENATVSDIGEVDYSYSLTNGTGISGEVNLAWHTLDTITGNQSLSYDLTNLPYTYLGVAGTIDFSGGNIKSFVINNLSNVTGQYILVNADVANGFDTPWEPATEHMTYVQPQGTLMFANPTLGWDVDSADRNLTITNQSTGNFTIELGFIGQSGNT